LALDRDELSALHPSCSTPRTGLEILENR